MLHSLRNFDESEAAGQRMKIIKFHEKYGEKATVEAFGADRKVIEKALGVWYFHNLMNPVRPF